MVFHIQQQQQKTFSFTSAYIFYNIIFENYPRFYTKHSINHTLSRERKKWRKKYTEEPHTHNIGYNQKKKNNFRSLSSLYIR